MFEKDKIRIYIGSDHAGYEYKSSLKDFLEEQGYKVMDLGAFTDDPSDYPDIAREVGEKVLEHEPDGAYGVLICGSGVGMCMAANKLRGIRAVAATSEEMAEGSRSHNNANVLSLGQRMIDVELAKKIMLKFLTTDFSGAERHVRRVNKMSDIEKL